MINVAMVGYSKLNSGHSGDIVEWMPGMLEGEKGLHYCYVGIFDSPNSDFHRIQMETMKSGADVLHFANYRDPYNQIPYNKIFLINIRLFRPRMPVLLTSAIPEAECIAAKLGISFLRVPFDMDQYLDTLVELSMRKDAA